MTTSLISRAEWGAQPSKRPLAPLPHIAGLYTVGHHSAGSVDQAVNDPYQAVRDIQNLHLHDTKNDYSDIAYNYLVSPTGLAFVGRGLHQNGANGTGFNPYISNSNSMSICLLGNGDDARCVTTEAKRTVDSLISDIVALFSYGTVVVGHKDKEATHCPGDLYYAWLHGTHPDPALSPPKDKVLPMYDPPIQVVANCAGPKGLGELLLLADGGVYHLDTFMTFPPGSVLSPVGQPYWQGRTPATIELTPDQAHYTITATSGETYTFPY